MSSQASSQGSEKNKNLIAAKASLGLPTGGSTTSSHHRNPVKGNSTHSVSSSVSGSTISNESSRKFPSSSSSTRSGYRSTSSATSEGKKSTHSNSKSSRVHETSFGESNASHVTSESGSKLSSSHDNRYDDKIDYYENTGATSSMQSIEEETNSVLDGSNTNLSQSQGSGLYDSNTNFSEGSDLYNSNTNLSERSDLYDSNANMTESSDLYDSNANFSQSQGSGMYDSNTNFSRGNVDDISQRSREDFVPQRFDEMRTLLSSITPMQLEALIDEIFGNDGPPGWRFKGKKSKRGFRKDAYLSELSLEELQNFARGMDNLGLDYCSSNEEALDLIAIEFERLVSLNLNKDDESYLQSSSAVSFEDDQMTRDSGTSEGDNLRRSLRACSFAELRLVAERLRLDPSVCVTKEELILMIESSMPDLLDSISQGSQSQSLLEYYSNYSHPSHHQQQQQRRTSQERGRKVKFSDGEGRRKVKFATDTKEGKSLPMSTRKGNMGDGQDLESAPLVQTTNGWKESSRFSVIRKHVWKIAALILLLVLIIGLSAGLSGRKSKGGNEANSGRPYMLLPENDQFFSDFYASSRTPVPSSMPSQPMSLIQEQPSSLSGGVFVMNRKPTTKPTSFPSTGTYMPTQTDTKDPTYTPTLMPVGSKQIIETEKPSALPKFSTISTAQPTPLSPYPLHGPYEEAGMRMVVYGISELSQMGETQFKMLTAAYVEQFYNDEGRGTDAFQNIVFDVSSSIDITNVESPPTKRRRGRARRLQSGILIITFTMNLSYRSFSNDVDAKTVSERPFFEESMQADFVKFLRDNNAAKFVGDVSDVSSIFRGDDIPEIIHPQGQHDNSPGEEYKTVESNSPSMKPVESNSPSMKPVAAETAKPTPFPISPPSSSPVFPTLFPSYNPTPSPTRRQTNEPTPTPGIVFHTYSPVKQVMHTFSPVSYRRDD
eukprot:scaffold26620_cov160-Skeletonema_menzelii.AAC.3